MILNLFALLIFAPLLFWMATFIYTSFRGSPYVPLKNSRLDNITKLIKKGDRVADLGAGDGRILVQAIHKGAAQASGWESDFLVYLTSIWRTKKSNVDTSKIKLIFGDFWNANLKDYNVIYCYQMTKYLRPFKQKIYSQLKKGTLIISPDYQIPGLKLHKKIKDADRGIYVYKV